MSFRNIVITCLFCLLPLFLFAEGSRESAAFVLKYCPDPAELEVRRADGSRIEEPAPGLRLQAGAFLHTEATVAEFRIEPSGSIIKIGRHTDLATRDLTRHEGGRTLLEVTSGILRSVVAPREAGEFSIETPTAVSGVRGTDFGVHVEPGRSESVFVLAGEVQVRRRDGKSILLEGGTATDLLVTPLQAVPLEDTEYDRLPEDLDFEALEPAEAEESEGESETDGAGGETDSGETDGVGGESDGGESDGGSTDGGDSDSSDGSDGSGDGEED